MTRGRKKLTVKEVKKASKVCTPKTRWTDSDDNVLLEILSEHTDNLKQGFALAAVQLNRTESAVSGHWYATLSKDPRREATIFYTISRKRYSRNRRSMKDEIAKDTLKTQSWWQKILNFLFD